LILALFFVWTADDDLNCTVSDEAISAIFLDFKHFQ
jgi:hypothetical protein